jgi:hypothetical protein
MNELDIKSEKRNLQIELVEWFNKTKTHIQSTPSRLKNQLKLLTNIRKDIYEDLNQLQHKGLIIATAELLLKIYPKINKWTWHPKQTSHPDEADLTGFTNNKVILNAEVTTSLRPVGSIDTRMRNTLLSLNKKEGHKYYIVQTNEMFGRAKTKIRKMKLKIKAQQI